MYRGPGAQRIAGQFDQVRSWAGESVTWRQWVSASSGNTSAYFAGDGVTNYYNQRRITALFAAPRMGETRFRETMLPGGEVIAGDAVISTLQPMDERDEIVWRGVTYRVASDATPIHIQRRLWYRTVLRRGDATG